MTSAVLVPAQQLAGERYRRRQLRTVTVHQPLWLEWYRDEPANGGDASVTVDRNAYLASCPATAMALSVPFRRA